jgi:LysR family hydrogen peroxide-inducible transcriptional activator
MTLTELRYIVALADERHFGRAAARCFVSQPSLSASVKKLEAELGVELFERGHGDVLVTDTGKRVLEQARRTLDSAEKVKAAAQVATDPLRGPLSLGVIHTIAPYLLPDLVAELRNRAPEMPLDIEENLTSNLDVMLRSGQIDLAVLALPYDAPGIATTPLYDEDFRVIVPARHRWARRKQAAAGELQRENLLLLNVGHCFRDQVLDACPEFALPATSGKQGNSLETIRNMVASGMGISVLPATALTPRYSSSLVKAIDFEPPEPSRRVVLAYRQGFTRGPVVELLRTAIGRLRLPIQPIS